MHLEDAARVLDAADFFSICNMEQKRMLAFASERRVLRPGEVLFRKGDVVPGAFVLMSGSLTSIDKEGASNEISVPGTVVAELALVTSHPRRATLTAQSEAELLMVPRDTFMKLMQQFPDVAELALRRVHSDLKSFVDPITQVRGKIKK
ncbi:MAG: cyclic nucleotide-binding domain-containing protein [Hyphomicrobiaceae bacterium]|nr:cyclic nucleotide-binding domain-containing protein [Hyphomicrobiaceae bacterium]MCC0024291.1 cyclic nucleotide-binding domain-containing protein [Hyphomicrobiaceae bacterium]